MSRVRLAVLALLLAACLPSVGCQYGDVYVDPFAIFTKDPQGIVHERGGDSKRAWREATGNPDWGRYDRNWIGP
jgi:hypothetical protein